jgi:hypothetical protein
VGCFPFPILRIDSDYQQITFTRSRPGKQSPGNKNDGAHVEQKNWARVRELVGYYRYDTAAELAKLHEIWALEARFTNCFLPQQKLVFKQRNGAEVTKRHHTAQTPISQPWPTRTSANR